MIGQFVRITMATERLKIGDGNTVRVCNVVDARLVIA